LGSDAQHEKFPLKAHSLYWGGITPKFVGGQSRLVLQTMYDLCHSILD